MSVDMHVLLEAEKEFDRQGSKFLELFTIPRNRRATLASSIVMFMSVPVSPHDRPRADNPNLGNSCKIQASSQAFIRSILSLVAVLTSLRITL